MAASLKHSPLYIGILSWESRPTKQVGSTQEAALSFRLEPCIIRSP